MLISNSQKFIFLHIPKTAGTSVSKSLTKSFQWNDLVIGSTELGELIQPYYNKLFGLNKHSFARDIKSVIGTETWNEYFKFAFVRHPYSRTVSLYSYIQRLTETKSLRDYIRFLLGKTRIQSWPIVQAYLETKDFSEFIRCEKFLNDKITASQTEYLSDERGKIDVDFIGKMENLEKDFAVIADKFNLKRITLGKNNVSHASNKSRKITLDEKDYTFLQKLYIYDFENFEYTPKLRL